MILLPRLALTALILSAVAAAHDERGGVGSPVLPRNWQRFTHIESVVVEPGHPMYSAIGGFSSVYGNQRALGALASGARTYPDGAILVLDLHQMRDSGHAVTAGARKLLGVMVRDDVKYAATGGWGYQAWDKGDPNRPQVTDMSGQCYACHTRAKVTGYVFSSWSR